MREGETFPNAQKMADSIVTLPLFSSLTIVQCEYIVSVIEDELNKYQ
jgi:dTDP-4-amino-4,6-dideoxygalactose transaminase